MAKNPLIEALRNNGSKTTFFECDSQSVSYKSGFPQLDYFLGYKVNVFNEDGSIKESYPSIGFQAGTFSMFIGKTSTGKTTAAVQIAANIVRPFASGSVIHYDLERAQNYSRIQVLTRFNPHDMELGKYILKQENTSIQDMKAAIMQLYMEKKSKPDVYKYDSGKVDEFGKPIKAYEPTVIIIDSIPLMTTALNENVKKDYQKLEEVSTQTDRMRLTAELGRFFQEILPYIKEANINIIGINHIKVNPQMGIVKSPAEILYLGQDEALPGGKACVYVANTLIKFVTVGGEKFTMEDDFFDGFGSKLQIIKSRTNQAGQMVHMIYDKVRGFDSLRSSVNFAKELGFLGGNRNGYYFVENKDQKFTLKEMHQNFKDNRDLYKIMYGLIIPYLEERLSTITPEEMDVPDDEFDY